MRTGSAVQVVPQACHRVAPPGDRDLPSRALEDLPVLGEQYLFPLVVWIVGPARDVLEHGERGRRSVPEPRDRARFSRIEPAQHGDEQPGHILRSSQQALPVGDRGVRGASTVASASSRGVATARCALPEPGLVWGSVPRSSVTSRTAYPRRTRWTATEAVALTPHSSDDARPGPA